MIPLSKLKQFKETVLGTPSQTAGQAGQEAMKARINDICNALNEVLKAKDCTLNEALVAFQAIQNGMTSVVQNQKVKIFQA